MGSASLAAARPAARPPARTVTTIPLQPGGLRGKKSLIFVYAIHTDTWHNNNVLVTSKQLCNVILTYNVIIVPCVR